MPSSVNQGIGVSDIQNVIKVCETHLAKSNLRGSEIESYLTRYLLVLICGDYENRIKRMILERVKRANDLDLASFVEKTYHKSYRGLKISDIRGNILERFSERHVAAFDQKIKLNDDPAIKYQNIVLNRHAIAHGQAANMTFDELVQSYKIAEKVLVLLGEVLRL
jgi:hypothetical protein